MSANKNKELSFESIDDLVSYYENEEMIEFGYEFEIEDAKTRFIEQTQGLMEQFHQFIREELKDELNRPFCPQCDNRVDELHKINGDDELSYCDDSNCRDMAFEEAERKFKW